MRAAGRQVTEDRMLRQLLAGLGAARAGGWRPGWRLHDHRELPVTGDWQLPVIMSA
jgi:hypothetical protein